MKIVKPQNIDSTQITVTTTSTAIDTLIDTAGGDRSNHYLVDNGVGGILISPQDGDIRFAQGVDPTSAKGQKIINGSTWVIPATDTSTFNLISTSGSVVCDIVLIKSEVKEPFILGGTGGMASTLNSALSSQNVAITNGKWTQRTGEEHFINESNLSAGTYIYEFSMRNYANDSIEWNISGGVTMTVWATNNLSADTSSSADWNDITTEVTGNASEPDTKDIAFMDTQICVGRIMLKFVTSDSTNAIDVYLNRMN